MTLDVESTLRTINEVPLVASLLFLLGALVMMFGGITWWSHRERMKSLSTIDVGLRDVEFKVSGNLVTLQREIETTRAEWATRDMAALNSQAQFGLIQQELTRAVTGLTTLIDGLLDKFNQREAADKARDESAERSQKAMLDAAAAIPGATTLGVKNALDEALRREFEALKVVIAQKIDDDKTHRTQVVDTILTRLTELKHDVTKMKGHEHEKAIVVPDATGYGTWNGASAAGPAHDAVGDTDGTSAG